MSSEAISTHVYSGLTSMFELFLMKRSRFGSQDGSLYQSPPPEYFRRTTRNWEADFGRLVRLWEEASPISASAAIITRYLRMLLLVRITMESGFVEPR